MSLLFRNSGWKVEFHPGVDWNLPESHRLRRSSTDAAARPSMLATAGESTLAAPTSCLLLRQFLPHALHLLLQRLPRRGAGNGGLVFDEFLGGGVGRSGSVLRNFFRRGFGFAPFG